MRVLAIQVLCRVQVINLKNIFEFVSLCVIYRVLFIFVRCSINGYFNMLSEASDIIAYVISLLILLLQYDLNVFLNLNHVVINIT